MTITKDNLRIGKKYIFEEWVTGLYLSSQTLADLPANTPVMYQGRHDDEYLIFRRVTGRALFTVHNSYLEVCKKVLHKTGTKRNQVTCRCSAYPFPHRKWSGNCDSCRHGKNWRGLDMALEEWGDWCEICAENEGYYPPRSETLSAAERNPTLR